MITERKTVLPRIPNRTTPDILTGLRPEEQFVFLNAYGHDLKSPITALQGYLQMYISDLPEDKHAQLSAHVDNIRTAAQLLTIKANPDGTTSHADIISDLSQPAPDNKVFETARDKGIIVSSITRPKDVIRRIQAYDRINTTYHLYKDGDPYFLSMVSDPTSKTTGQFVWYYKYALNKLKQALTATSQIVFADPDANGFAAPTANEYLPDVKKTLTRALQSIDEAMMLFQLGKNDVENEKETLDPNEEIANIITAESFNSDNVKVDLRIDQGTKITAHSPSFRRILTILINNAFRHQKGQITIGVKRFQNMTWVGIYNNGSSVADNAGDIFALGKQGENKGSSGVGLYIATLLTQWHDGKIGYKNPDHAQGAIFYVAFPN